MIGDAVQARRAVRRPGRRRLPELTLLLLGGLIVLRLVVAVVWLALDGRVLDTESGRHVSFTWDLYEMMAAGDVLRGFEAGNLYPPVHHLVGALGRLVGGMHPDASILAQDVVFVPLLAIGTYGAARIAYGRLAGILATVFVLCAPMIVSAFHMFQIDTPMTALTAVVVWLVLLSRRFERVGVAAAAGAAFGAGMLVKQNFVMFVIGVLAVAFLRGGWRNWRGVLAFCAIGAVLSVTYYWAEADRWLGLARGASSDAPSTDAGGAIYPGRWSFKNFGWYGWNAVNNQLFVPMTLLFLGGTATMAVRYLRRPSRSDFTPELFAGGLVAFAALTWIALKDSRYVMPATPYMAILAVAWVPLLRLRARRVAIAGIALLCAVNFAQVVTSAGPTIRPALAGAPHSGLGEREFTLLRPGGFVVGEPFSDGELVDLLRGARRDGVRYVLFDPGAIEGNFNHGGLFIAARMAGLTIPPAPNFADPDPRIMFITGRWPGQDTVTAPPCMTLEAGGRRVYFKRGEPIVPFEDWPEYYCPEPVP